MITTIVILIFVIIALIAALIFVKRDTNFKIEKWKEQYLEEKRNRKKAEEQAENERYKLELQMESYDEKIDVLLKSYAEMEDKYRQLQERACKADIERQKEALKGVGKAIAKMAEATIAP